MLLYISSDFVKYLHELLVEIYKGREFPYEIVEGYSSEGLVDATVDLAFRDTLMDEPLFPQILQKATVLLHQIIITHPFIDGNKRTALCSLYYFLKWNGFYFDIPKDTASFLIDIAIPSKKIRVTTIYEWVKSNTKRTLGSIIRKIFLDFLILRESKAESTLAHTFLPYLLWKPFPEFIEDAIRIQEYLRSSRD